MTSANAFRLVPYEAKYHDFYETHNRIWIQRNFELEEADIAQLTNPQAHVLDKGGRIYILLRDDEPVGGVSLLDEGREVFQLSKMYVPEALRGEGVGKHLLPAAIEEARKIGAKTLYLLTNTLQEAAVHLYHKAGFQPVPMTAEAQAKYARANLRMEMTLA